MSSAIYLTSLPIRADNVADNVADIVADIHNC